eukprot:IDg19938t1
MHISVNHSSVTDGDMPEEVIYPHSVKLVPQTFAPEYQNHPYWEPENDSQAGYDPTPSEDKSVSHSSE